jgi:hypothetical protein
MVVKHYQPAAVHVAPPAPPATSMVALLESRKATLEGIIRERHRAAREGGRPANVKMLSATLRALKRQLATAKRHLRLGHPTLYRLAHRREWERGLVGISRHSALSLTFSMATKHIRLMSSDPSPSQSTPESVECFPSKAAKFITSPVASVRVPKKPSANLVPELDRYRTSIVASLEMRIGSVTADLPSGSSNSQRCIPASISTVHGAVQTLSKLADEIAPVLVASDVRPRLSIDVPKVDTVPFDVPLRMLNVAPGSGDLRRTVTLDDETTLNILDVGPAVGRGVGFAVRLGVGAASLSLDESSVLVDGGGETASSSSKGLWADAAAGVKASAPRVPNRTNARGAMRA